MTRLVDGSAVWSGMTRKPADLKDERGGVCLAAPALHLHVPLGCGLRQLVGGGAALEEQADAVGGEQRGREREQLRQWGQGAGGDETRGRECGLFDAGGVHGDICFADACGVAQKGGFALVGFDQVDRLVAGDGEHQSGSPAPEPRSMPAPSGGRSGSSCRQSAMWRVHTCDRSLR